MNNVIIKIKRKSDNSVFGIGAGYEWKLCKNGLDGFGSFSNILNYVDNGIHDGGIITSSRMTKVDRSIKCAYINRSTNASQRKKVMSFFNLTDTYSVYITYMNRTLWADGMIYKFAISTNEAVDALMTLQITFTFANPFLKSYDDFGKDIASKTPLIGFPYLVTLDTNVEPNGLSGGAYNFDKDVLLTNSGDVETYCRAVFTATGEVVNPKLIIEDAYVKVNDTMEAGDIIEMDFTSFPPTVKKNGVNCIGKCDRASAFTSMSIKRGDASIKYDADDGDSNLSVSFYYNELFAGI